MQRIEAQMEAITIENRNLLAFAEASVTMVNNLVRSAPVAVLAADMRSEVEASVAQTTEGSAYERVRTVLDDPALLKSPSNTLPRTQKWLRSLVWNATDEKNQRLACNSIDPVKKVHAAMALAKRDKSIRHICDVLTRMRNINATPPRVIAETFRNALTCLPHRAWQAGSGRYQVMSRNWQEGIVNQMKKQGGYSAKPSYPVSRDYSLEAADNFEISRKTEFPRYVELKDGTVEKRDYEFLHTVTSVIAPVDARITDGIKPELHDKYPFQSKADLRNALLTPRERKNFITECWKLALVVTLDGAQPGSLMHRPDADFEIPREQVPLRHPPIIMYCGTQSREDARRIIKHARENSNATVKIIAGDQQTFNRINREKMSNPSDNQDIVPWIGEWHARMHNIDAVFRMGWPTISAFAVCMGWKNIQKVMIMKHSAARETALFICLGACLKWLSTIFPAEEMAKPEKLVDWCKLNVPVWDFVGMCIYLILPIWRQKFATRCNDSKTLNTMWQYSLLMMGGTVDPGKDRDSPGKTQYQATAPQVLKILWDSEPNIKAILDVMRTHAARPHGKPCASRAWDMVEEHVCSPPHTVAY